MQTSCSVVMATYDGRDRWLLRDVIRSIINCNDNPKHTFDEIILVNTGHEKFWFTHPKVKHLHFPLPIGTNPAKARNYGLKHAKGDVVILQSDDIVHASVNSVERLATACLETSGPAMAMVFERDKQLKIHRVLCGSSRPQALFFLGAISRADICAVAGYDENFPALGYDDNWLESCITYGLGKHAVLCENVVGFHEYHARPENLEQQYRLSRGHYDSLMAERKFLPDNPWRYQQGMSVMEVQSCSTT